MKQSSKMIAKTDSHERVSGKMKPDTTSARRILSRKIRARLRVIFTLLLLGFMLVLPANSQAGTSLIITPEILNSTPKNQLVIVDTRSKFKYWLGHIPDAVHLGKWQDFTHKVGGVRGLLIKDRHLIVSKLKSHGIDHNKTIVVYGEPKNPWRTDGRFFWMFERFGFEKVALLEGGLDNWLNSGGKLEIGQSKPRKSSTLTIDDISFNNRISADQEWIASRLGSKNLAIIDNRTREEYDGGQPYGSHRGGHIPTAINIHWPDFFSKKGHMKEKTKISAILERHKISSDKEVVVYCTGGVRSGMAYIVLRYLDYKVRNYDGSWWDWSLNPKLPIETS